MDITYLNNERQSAAARSAVATLMAKHGATLDRIDDAKLALAEATFLLARQEAERELTVYLSAKEDGMHIFVSGGHFRHDDLSWTVLSAVSTELSADDTVVRFFLRWV